MRQQINENPVVQAVMVGVLLVLCGFLLYTRVVASSSSEQAAPPPTTPVGETAATPPATGTESAAAPTAVAPATGAAAPEATAPPTTGPEPATVVPGKLEAGKGMPEPVVEAYDADKAVVLLIVRQAGVDDKRVRASVNLLELDSDLAVFTTGAKNVARYSQIANGVGVSRVPALIVMQPRSVSDVPTASISYGFRSPASVAQAVKDALYKGPDDIPYYPE
jgi:hypothetical protein